MQQNDFKMHNSAYLHVAWGMSADFSFRVFTNYLPFVCGVRCICNKKTEKKRRNTIRLKLLLVRSHCRRRSSTFRSHVTALPQHFACRCDVVLMFGRMLIAIFFLSFSSSFVLTRTQMQNKWYFVTKVEVLRRDQSLHAAQVFQRVSIAKLRWVSSVRICGEFKCISIRLSVCVWIVEIIMRHFFTLYTSRLSKRR